MHPREGQWYGPAAMPSPWPGGVVLVVVLIAYDACLALLRRADRAFPSTNPTESTWWFGYARDLANLGAMALFSLGFSMLGFGGPTAMLAGCTLGLVMYGLDFAIGRRLSRKRAGVTLGLTMLVVTLALVVARTSVRAALEGFMAVLFRSP
jgi:hypothetical protein